MKRSMVLLTLLAALAACAGTPEGTGEALSLDDAIAASAADIAGKLPPGTRVAIVAFESPHGNLSAYIMDEVTGALVDGSLEVADRNNLEYVYKELNFQMSGDVSDEEAVGIGKFLGARYVITGQFMDLGRRCRYRLNGINVETARHEISTRLDVRNDGDFQEMFAALQKAAPVVRTASYGAGGTVPRTAGTFLDRGIMFAGRGEYDLAIADFSEAVRLDGEYTAAYGLRGNAYYYKGDYDNAIADYTQAIRLDSEYAGSYILRGNAYHIKGDYDKAISDFNQAIRLNPMDAVVYSLRGNAYSNKGDNDRAIADYDQAIQLDPEYAAAYFNRGIAYNSKRDYDRAIADYTQAIRLNPELAVVYNNRGIVYSDKGDVDKAIADYTQAIRLDPDYAAAYFNRGWVYLNKGDYDKAIADYNQAIRLDPEDAWTYNSRGIAYASKEDYRRARADWEQALQLDSNHAGARDNLERLRQMGY
ncbi:MAG: tetratricopeptide repeat protein [Treponema sp.]|nr:tetratricopeptide repeat protein [Treponema sp.]